MFDQMNRTVRSCELARSAISWAAVTLASFGLTGCENTGAPPTAGTTPQGDNPLRNEANTLGGTTYDNMPLAGLMGELPSVTDIVGGLAAEETGNGVIAENRDGSHADDQRESQHKPTANHLEDHILPPVGGGQQDQPLGSDGTSLPEGADVAHETVESVKEEPSGSGFANATNRDTNGTHRWIANNGREVAAEFLEIIDGQVFLRKVPDGPIIGVKVSLLSEDSQRLACKLNSDILSENGGLREWNDITGRFSQMAVLSDSGGRDGLIRLQKPDGSTIEVDRKQLSIKDLAYLEWLDKQTKSPEISPEEAERLLGEIREWKHDSGEVVVEGEFVGMAETVGPNGERRMLVSNDGDRISGAVGVWALGQDQLDLLVLARKITKEEAVCPPRYEYRLWFDRNGKPVSVSHTDFPTGDLGLARFDRWGMGSIKMPAGSRQAGRRTEVLWLQTLPTTSHNSYTVPWESSNLDRDCLNYVQEHLRRK